jgi:peptidoglycan-N-acetylglucosamine deacetylase
MSGNGRRVRPGGAEAVVCITIHVDGPACRSGGNRAPRHHCIGRYAMRRGVPRYLDMLDRNGVPATFFVCGHDAKHYRAVISSIGTAGHEIAAHGKPRELGPWRAGTGTAREDPTAS